MTVKLIWQAEYITVKNNNNKVVGLNEISEMGKRLTETSGVGVQIGMGRARD